MKYIADHWEFDGRNRVLAITVGLSPIWLQVWTLLTMTKSYPYLYPTEAEFRAAGTVVVVAFALAGLLTLAGAVVLWRARSTRAAVGAILLLTLPALILVLLWPAFFVNALGGPEPHWATGGDLGQT